MENHQTPSRLVKNTSELLAEVFFQTCTPIEKVLYGRDRGLKGPQSELWINPNHRKERQVLITPRVENIQALTHQGILEIGKQIEVKMSEANTKVVEKAIQDTEELAK